MSYSILYDRIIISLPDGSLIPLVKIGDNNVWTTSRITGKTIRSRSWQDFKFCDNRISYTKEELLSRLDSLSLDGIREGVSREAFLKQYGWHAGVTIYGRRDISWGEFRIFFTKAIGKAVPMETFTSLFCPLQLCWWETDFRRSGPLRTPEELQNEWNARSSRGLGTIWIEPASERMADLAADIVGAPTPRGRTIKALYTAPDGTERESFVKSLLPLEFTQDPLEAAGISKKITGADSIFETFRRLSAWKMDFSRFTFSEKPQQI